MDFADQVAIVTGASSGIGKSIALGLARHGAAVGLVARRLDRLEAVAEVARLASPQVRVYPVDLSHDEDVLRLAEALHRDFPRIDILVNSAGAISWGRIENTPVEELDRQLATNVRGPYVLIQALLPMLRRGRAQVVFINSTAGLVAKANVGPYAATKHALKALAESLREELNIEGFRILSVFVGRTATPMQEGVHTAEGRAYKPDLLIQPEDVATVVIDALLLPNTVEVTDISLRPLRKPVQG